MNIKQIIDEEYQCFLDNLPERKERFYADISSPMLILMTENVEKNMQEDIKDFFNKTVSDQNGIFLLTYAIEKKEIKMGSMDALHESVPEQMKQILLNVQEHASLFEAATALNICFVLDTKDALADHFCLVRDRILQMLPVTYTVNFYIFCFYNEMDLEKERLKRSVEFLKKLDIYQQEHREDTIIALGAKKLNGGLDGDSQVRKYKKDIVCYLLFLISQRRLPFKQKGKIYAAGIAEKSEYIRELWNAKLLELADCLLEKTSDIDLAVTETGWAEVEAFIRSISMQMSTVDLSFALMNPVTARQVCGRSLREVEFAAFGNSLEYYVRNAAKQTYRMAADQLQQLIDKGACSLANSKEEFDKRIYRLNTLLEELNTDIPIYYDQIFQENFAFEPESVRRFVIENIYEKKIIKIEHIVKKEIIERIQDWAKEFWKEKEEFNRQLLKIREEIIKCISTECRVKLQTEISIKDNLKSRIRNINQIEVKREEIVRSLCREAGKFLSVENIDKSILKEENFERISNHMNEKVSPYCMEYSDDVSINLLISGSGKDRSFCKKYAENTPYPAQCFEFSCLWDVWVVSYKEISVSKLECVFLGGEE